MGVEEKSLRVEETPRESPPEPLATPSPASAPGGFLHFLGIEPDFLKLWLARKPFVIGPPSDPYLLRWYVIPRNKWFNVYVHKFCRSDDDRALHDHPWWWVSVILKQGYYEHTEKSVAWRKPGSVVVRGAEVAHRVELNIESDPTRRNVYNPFTQKITVYTREVPAWTLFITGPKVRNWGFHCPKGWQPWEKFTAGKNGQEVGAGCGELS